MLQGAGSPRWMAPELVLRTDSVIGPVKSLNSDVYAFGHAMLEVVTRCIPAVAANLIFYMDYRFIAIKAPFSI